VVVSSELVLELELDGVGDGGDVGDTAQDSWTSDGGVNGESGTSSRSSGKDGGRIGECGIVTGLGGGRINSGVLGIREKIGPDWGGYGW
jgi:hypothetical protein